MEKEVVIREDGLVVSPTATNAVRAAAAYKLRQQGLPWEEIRDKTGYASISTVATEVKRMLQKASLELDKSARGEILALELARLDALQSAAWDNAMAGDIKSIDASLRIINARMKLLGLDVETVQTTSNTIIINDTKEDYIKQLKVIAGEIDK